MKRIAYYLSLLRRRYAMYKYESYVRRLRQTVEESSEIRSVSDGVYVDGSYIFVRGVPIAKITDEVPPHPNDDKTVKGLPSNPKEKKIYQQKVTVMYHR